MHFHLCQHRHQGAFQPLVDAGNLVGMQLWLEQLPQAQSDIGIFGGIFRSLVHRHPVKGDRGFARPQQGLDRDRRVVQIPLRQCVHAVIVQTPMQRIT